MFIVLLRFSANKDQAGQYMESHKAWVGHGVDDGVFLLAGSLKPTPGGGILADNTTLAELERRVGEDPFVANDVVTAEIIELTPSFAAEPFRHLLAN